MTSDPYINSFVKKYTEENNYAMKGDLVNLCRIIAKEQRDVIVDSFYTKPFRAQAQRIVQETPLVI